jgi:hypothetical protein
MYQKGMPFIFSHRTGNFINWVADPSPRCRRDHLAPRDMLMVDEERKLGME